MRKYSDVLDSDVVGEVFESGKKVLYFKPRAAIDQIKSDDLTVRVVVAWNYRLENESGMPSPQILGAMTEFNNSLLSTIPSRKFQFIYSRIGNGVGELGYYVANQKDFSEKLILRSVKSTSHPNSIDFFGD
ncbi:MULTISPECIES: DUF695 domain-containing protein [Pseudomonas syringae group genomosp. 2]|uniref:Uncharacterized protein n=1 Tax=Pseudomonas amygdali pv. mori TaxID=34065 RepID=A0A0P9V1B3_PSEA0|nr:MULTISPECIES: DUF695 domain-containing protein [Pseudomonas syringae group genomosp. 2]KPX96411.1 Uncharacterized protein ALO63_03832 [Pseudomonas amygdali pv. mori]RMQ44416.1 hypothetical protein ALQ05_200021 [Pseudomonas amygdali pv. mori]RMT22816.1 hypothetical protein ALP52_02115 [Pseudomonas amygdali pv. mori]